LKKIELIGIFVFESVKKTKIKAIFFCLIIFKISFPNDTTIFVNKNNEIIHFNSDYIDSSSFKIMTEDSLEFLKWSYDKKSKNLILDELPKINGPIKINYYENFLNYPKTSSFFSKQYFLSIHSTYQNRNINYSFLKKNEELSLYGYKSFSLSVDNNGALFFDQGLDIQLKGNLKKETEISGHLSDKGSSLENTTKEISDFDFIYLKLKNPKYEFIIGDQYIDRKNWIYNTNKKVKGISGSFKNNSLYVKTFGSLAGGMFTKQNIIYIDGVQGPYYLTGNGEDGFIQPVNGTVIVSINGKNLKENDDYIIDYELGTLTFKNTILLKKGNIISTDYEYKLFDYQKYFYGVQTAIANKDTTFSISSSLFVSSDNKNNPIDIVLTEQDIKEIKSKGDTILNLSSQSEVDPRDVASMSQLYPLYIKGLSGSDTIFIYKQFDPLYPSDNNGYYQVWFNHFGDNKGDYEKDTIIHNGVIMYTYYYKGKNQGTYLPIKEINSPKRNITGEIQIVLKKKQYSLSTRIAGENNDNNIFSKKDDSNNNGAAVNFISNFGDKNNTRFWINNEYWYNTHYFTDILSDKFTLYKIWNDTTQYFSRKSKQYYKTDLGLKILTNNYLNVGIAQRFYENEMYNTKVNGEIDFYKSLLNYSFSHYMYKKNDYKYTNLNNINSKFMVFENDVNLSASETWNNKNKEVDNGQILGSISTNFEKIKLKEFIEYRNYRKGMSLINSKDTGFGMNWEQSIKCKPQNNWSLFSSSIYSYEFDKEKNTKNKTLLIKIDNELDFKIAEINQSYSTNFEKSSSLIQIPIYAGKGLGTHSYDSIKKEFFPHIPGDWFMQNKELSNSDEYLRIRKSDLMLELKIKKPKKTIGILADLEWNGYLAIKEDIDVRENRTITWLPGFLTISNYKNKKYGNNLKNADFSYKQDITWRPDWNTNINGKFYLNPSIKYFRSYFERIITSGLILTTKKNRLLLENEVGLLNVIHDDSITYQDMKFTDLHLSINEKVEILNNFSLIGKQTIGNVLHQKNITTGLKLDNSKIYYQLSPGISWNKEKIGNIEFLYTFSDVRFNKIEDYRIANGYRSGKVHIISLHSNINAGKNLLLSGYYRFEYSRDNFYNNKRYIQALNIEAKLFF
jgi:hypothetical protein